ncbi:hypothetical protein [Nitrospina gracilis]|uniref:hypothetical protein n=1 Tax=Nitrospina gracilis TaxID=35801 RepID=UPI001F2AD2F1|nr:hypothetical protein [Nitrospina gracilis]MCF8721607.1 hypothetical protein [Nitrospina gracilis Nb-211]
MAIGESGRIVIEISPDLKKRLYATLALEQKTLKEWFILKAEQYIKDQIQPSLFQDEKEL